MTLETVETKAFVPAKDFEISKAFYQDLGFECAWSSDVLAYFHHGSSAFLLQNFYTRDFAENFQMHLLVKDANAWWRHIRESGLIRKYEVRAEPPEDRSWGLHDFPLIDPSGVCWRIGHNIPTSEETQS